jgi:uncharacterized protein YcbK (DUF882 family)
MSTQFNKLLKAGTASFCLMAFNTACTTNSHPDRIQPAANDPVITQTDTPVAPTQLSGGLAFVQSSAGTLRFFNTHTSERITITHRPGQPLSQAANWFMRDHRRGEPADLDPRLMDLLADLQNAIEARYPHLNGKIEYHVISAYRSPATNAGLRAAGGGQARQSLHMTGDAIDIRVPGLSTAQLRDVALSLRRGGVGYYPQDNFVHVDIGRVRTW